MFPNSEAILHKLRAEFLDKIQSEWELKWKDKYILDKYVFADLKSQTAFLDDLQSDIELSLKQKIGLDKASQILVSRDSLRRILATKEPKNWQEKTKNMLAIYVGYESWDEYETYCTHLLENGIVKEDNYSDKEEFASPNQKIKIWKTRVMWVLLGSGALLLSGAIYYYYYSTKDSPKFSYFQANQRTESYPTTFDVNYEISNFEVNPKTFFKIENELLAYTKTPTIIPLSTERGAFKCEFSTPGLKQMSLVVNGEVVSQKRFLITTGKNWYGCARVKTRQFPSNLLQENLRSWYGFMNIEQNTKDNWLTTPTVWEKYINLYQGKSNYPNGVLTFPKEQTKILDENFTRRVAFLKAEKFPVSLDSVSVSFVAKRETILTEDCMSFMFQMYDEDLNRFEIYSSKNCGVFNFSAGKLLNSGKYNYFSEVAIEELNDILEDGNMHHFQFEIKNQTLTIYIDNKKIGNFATKMSYKQLREIWLVFEGNGYVDDFLLSNSFTKKEYLNDNFGIN